LIQRHVIFNDTSSNGAEAGMPSSYTLGARFEAFVKTLVATGRYNNASEVVRDGLRLLEDREKLREVKIAELRRLAEEGRLSGISDDDGEAVLDRLEAKYRRLAEPG
jgi:antitoxin ParD1/3/4